MIPAQISFPASRARRVAAFVCAFGAFAIAACSSDPRSTLGSDDDLIGSEPGTIFDDTLDVGSDTTFVYETALAYDDVLELGRVSGYQRAMVIQISWEKASLDAGRTVDDASLRIMPDDVDGDVPARFYQLAEPYAEGDSVPSLDTLSVIIDPDTGSPNRTLVASTRENPLPPALVQQWIRGEIDRNAIAVVYPDDVNDRIATFKALQAGTDIPQLYVHFTDGTSRTYFTNADATFVRPTTTTSNLVISDGYVRRLYFRIPFDQLADRAAVHNARVRLYIVPGSTLGSDPNLIVFIPKSSDPTSADFLTGQNVTAISYQASADYVEFSMTNAVALTLDGTLEDTGVVVRYDAENSSLRQVQFYGSDAPANLRPRIHVTSSTPADFHPGTP